MTDDNPSTVLAGRAKRELRAASGLGITATNIGMVIITYCLKTDLLTLNELKLSSFCKTYLYLKLTLFNLLGKLRKEESRKRSRLGEG